MEKKKAWGIIMGTYGLCWGARLVEYLLIRTDQTIIGEAFLHKLVGILVLGACLMLIDSYWTEIGFSTTALWKNLMSGLLLGAGTFSMAYGINYYLTAQSDSPVKLAYYITSYSMEGNQVTQSGPLFLFLCILGNLINVIMEEGLFRGLYLKLFEQEHSFFTAALYSSFLFGVWHIAAPLRAFVDVEATFASFALSGIVQIVLTGLMGFQLCLLVKITGSLWASMAVHFVNNFLVNVLHVVTASGIDPMQGVRISIAQTVSFLIVLLIYLSQKASRKKTFRS